jgi:hypothetical protein
MLTYEGGMKEFSQVVVENSNGTAFQLNRLVRGLKNYTTTHLVHLDTQEKWMVVTGFESSFYGDGSYRTGTMGEQLYWISFR